MHPCKTYTDRQLSLVVYYPIVVPFFCQCAKGLHVNIFHRTSIYSIAVSCFGLKRIRSICMARSIRKARPVSCQVASLGNVDRARYGRKYSGLRREDINANRMPATQIGNKRAALHDVRRNRTQTLIASRGDNVDQIGHMWRKKILLFL